MKKTTQLLALGLVLFLGACSTTEKTTEDKFLDKVKGKKITSTGVHIIVRGEFSEDGRSLDLSQFIEASDENTGKYQGKMDVNIVTSTIKITGAKTLTITPTWSGQPVGTDAPELFTF